jgi:ATP-binding cassette subfamily F protein 3
MEIFTMTLLIQAAGIAHAHGGNELFEDLLFEIRLGDRIALIGENGAGKSTLMKIAARLIKPDRGSVTWQRGIRVGYLKQDPDFATDVTARSIVALAAGDVAALETRLAFLEGQMSEPLGDDELADVMDEYAVTLGRLEEIDPETAAATGEAMLSGLGLAERVWDTPVSSLSGGEKRLVALAELLLQEPDVLLLDEPDNHLDFRARSWLEARIREHKGAVALISHDRYLIDQVCTAIAELEDGKIVLYPGGGYSRFLETKRDRLLRQAELRELEERQFKKLKASAEQLTQWARQNPKFASRAENQRRKLAEERERLEAAPIPVLRRRRIDVSFDASRGSTIALEATALAKSFGERQVFRPFDFVVRQGESIALVGPNGAGKTTLFRMLLGQEPPSGGALRIGGSTLIGYYAQEHETLDPAKTPLETVRRLKPWTEQQAISFLSTLLFTRDDSLNRISQLSGGERARLQIAALMLGGANLLLLDEPTNNLDLASREALESALVEFDGTMITISHDRYFLDNVCTRTIEVKDGLVTDYPGGYSEYLSRSGMGTLLTRMPPVAPAAKKSGKQKAGVG